MNISFEGDNGFVLIHAIISYSLLLLALFLNTLVFILVKFSKKIADFRNLFYTNCVVNVVIAIVFSISLLQWVFLPGFAAYFPTGPFAYDVIILPIVFRIQNIVYLYVMCLVCATFVYRYFAVVRNSRGIKARSITSLLFLPVLFWFFNHSKITIIPDADLRSRINDEIGNRFGLNFQNIHMFIIETRNFEYSMWNVARISNTLFQLNLFYFIMIWAGLRIYQTIQKSVGSQQSKRMERNALRLLLSQAINPMILLHAPTLLNVIQAEIVVLPDTINQVSCVLMSLFAVTNPLLNIIFSRDLSHSLKYVQAQRKKSSVFVAQQNL